MTYMAAQALLKTRLLTLTTYFDATDVTEGDLRVLDANPGNAAVLFPGSVSYETIGMEKSRVYEGILALFTRFADDTTYSTFGTLRDAIITNLDGDPCLSATYWVAAINSDGDPEELFDKSGAGPFFITQQLRLTFLEQV